MKIEISENPLEDDKPVEDQFEEVNTTCPQSLSLKFLVLSAKSPYIIVYIYIYIEREREVA